MEKKKIKTPITIQNLSLQIVKGFKEVNTNHDQLIGIMGQGFIGLQKQLNSLHSDVRELKDGQEAVKLHLDNLPIALNLKN